MNRMEWNGKIMTPFVPWYLPLVRQSDDVVLSFRTKGGEEWFASLVARAEPKGEVIKFQSDAKI